MVYVCVCASILSADQSLSLLQQGALYRTCTVWWSLVTSISLRSRPRACLLLPASSFSPLNMYVHQLANTHTHTHTFFISDIIIMQLQCFRDYRLRPLKKSGYNQRVYSNKDNGCFNGSLFTFITPNVISIQNLSSESITTSKPQLK